MKQVAPLSYPTLFFLTLATLLSFMEFSPITARIFAWMGGIQLVNSFAPRFPFSRMIHWLHAMTFELFALVGVAVLRFIPTKYRCKGDGKPILLVHGYVNHSSVWLFFKRRLEALGFGPIYAINLGHPFRSIQCYAEKVKAMAEQIAKETGRNDLILIGHSMGGIVSSLYATKFALPNSVTDVITIASPLHGTPMAHIGLGPNAKEMRPRSELLAKLCEDISKNQEIRFFHLGTKTDQVVVPGSSAILQENKHFLVEDLGHASLLYSKRTSHQVAEWLRADK